MVSLCGLSDVKTWLGIVNVTTNDAVLTSLIQRSSQAVLSYLNRANIAPTSYTEYLGNRGREAVQLRNWPVLSVQSVQIFDRVLSAINPLTFTGYSLNPGYILDPWDGALPGTPQTVRLIGYTFPRLSGAAQAVYQAGYQTVETHTVPATGPYTIATNAFWLSDISVAYQNGTVLTPVSNSPAAGQYSVSAGIYTFNAADQGSVLTVTFGFCPDDIVQATIEFVANRWKAKDRIGLNSQSLTPAGAVSFDRSSGGIPMAIKSMLQPYCRVVPS